MPFHSLESMGNLFDRRLCFFDRVPKGVERYDYCFHFGEPVRDEYPRDAKLYMEQKHKGVRLSDVLGNSSSMLLASSAFRRLIEKHCRGVAIEYLPFTIMDHKGRPYSDDYCIVNPVGTYDCADLEASVLERIDTGKVAFVTKLVLSRKKVAKAPQLFRFDLFPRTYVLGPKLSDDILANKLTNLVLEELEVTPK